MTDELVSFNKKFFTRDAFDVAPDLIGKILVRRHANGEELRKRITEVEIYYSEADTACHAHKGRTQRSELLYKEGGILYVYLCYGIHNLMNIITGEKEFPQGILLRTLEDAKGPGLLTKTMSIDRSFNGQSIVNNPSVWLEDDGRRYNILLDKRVGIDYAAEIDRERLWRYKLGEQI